METLRLMLPRTSTSTSAAEPWWGGRAAQRLANARRTPADLAELAGTQPVELSCSLMALRRALADPRARAVLAAPPAAVLRVRVAGLTFDLDLPDAAASWRLLVARLSAVPPDPPVAPPSSASSARSARRRAKAD